MLTPWYVLRYLAYLLGMVIWSFYSFLSFLSKPGSRRIIPVIFGSLLALCFWWLFPAFVAPMQEAGTEPGGIGFGAATAVGLGLAIAIFVVIVGVLAGAHLLLSRLLALLLNTFPPMRRPLPPLPPLPQTTKLDDPVKVLVIVPPLPHASRGIARSATPSLPLKSAPLGPPTRSLPPKAPRPPVQPLQPRRAWGAPVNKSR